MLGVRTDKDISSMEAAEQANYGIKAEVDLNVGDTLETLSQLIVTVGSHIVRGHILLVHEILEGYIAVLLELDVILE
jgi:hypothetical protein